MRILVCGSRTFDNKWIMPPFVRGLTQCGHDELVLINGAAQGADAMAAAWWEIEQVGPIESYPADWDRYGPSAGPIRNLRMLEEGKPDIVLAFVDKPLEESYGTNHMVTQAVEADVPTYVIQRM